MYLAIASWIVRIILRVYFIVALILICAVGDKCLHLRAKIRLLHGKDVGVASKDCRYVSKIALLTNVMSRHGWMAKRL